MYNISDFSPREKRRGFLVKIILCILGMVAIGCMVMIGLTIFGGEKTSETVSATESATEVVTTTEAPTSTTAPTETVTTTVASDYGVAFTEVDETVTPKEALNLRTKPSQDDDSSVIVVLYNGDQITRTGISDSGWSRLVYNNTVCYAVSSYLTTDLAYAPETTTDDGINTVFQTVSDQVTAKEEVNLRSIPSVTNTDSQIIATLKNGETVTRTGTSDNGWSRVEYNGQILYCVTSYLEIVQ